MTGLSLLWLLAILAGSIGPGLLVVRRLRWSPLERLCGAIVASQAIIYVLSGLVYAANAPRWVHLAIALACLACSAVAWREAASYFANRSARRAIIGFAFLACWGIAFLAMIRTYSGGAWRFDWLEHYQRTMFFLEHKPLDTKFTGLYLLPARPPLMNLLVGHFMAASAIRFEFFQVASLVLNLLLFFPGCLFLRWFGPRRGGQRWAILVLLCLFAANPMVIHNAAYAWTKSLATFHVVAAFWFYFRALRRRDPLSLAAAAIAFATGLLVHFSAAPFLIFAALHYAILLFRGKAIGAGKTAAAVLPAVALLALWFGWSYTHFGIGATIGSNTTVTGAAGATIADFAAKVGRNLFYSVAPHPLHVRPFDFLAEFFQPSSWGFVRDYAFTILQTNVIFSMGTVGGIAVLSLLIRSLRGAFWIAFALGLTVITIATHPTVDLYGVAHVCSQPLMILGIVLLAARFSGFPRWARCAIIAGAAVDFAAGIVLQAGIEHWSQVVLPLEGGRYALEMTTDMPNRWAVEGAIAKYVLQYSFLGDHCAGIFAVLLGGAVLAIIALFALVLRRHGDLPATGIPATVGFGIGAIGLVGFAVAVGSAATAAPTPMAGTDARMERALASARQLSVKEAMVELGDAFAADPRPGLPRYLAFLIDGVYSAGLPPTVEAAESVMRHSDSANSQNELGVALLGRREFEAAAARFALAHELDPRNGIVSGNLGRTYLQLGRIEEGIAAMRDAIREAPSNPEFHYALAFGLARANQREETIAELQEAVRLKPDYKEAIEALRSLGK